MTEFTLYNLETASAEAKPLLQNALAAFGMIPNLTATMAESPEALEGYQKLHELFQQTSLTNVERHVVWLAINVEHNCGYCVPAHTMIAKMQGVDDATIEALRNAAPLADAKLEALRTFTLKVLRTRGTVSDADMEEFFAAGYGRRQLLDILLGLAQKVMSNYMNHMAKTPVDAPFAAFEWTPAQAAE